MPFRFEPTFLCISFKDANHFVVDAYLTEIKSRLL